MPDRLSYRFPGGFAWGVERASCQIEGAATEDGKGESAWDRFATLPGKVKQWRHGPAVACDHYHRYESRCRPDPLDLGIDHYRLSIAWPRVVPDGDGAVHEARPRLLRSVDRRLAGPRGSRPGSRCSTGTCRKPWKTRGDGRLQGHGRRRSPAYSEVVVKSSGRPGRAHWFTVNEIPCFIGNGYGNGIVRLRPRKESAKVVNQAYHHAILAHGHGRVGRSGAFGRAGSRSSASCKTISRRRRFPGDRGPRRRSLSAIVRCTERNNDPDPRT